MDRRLQIYSYREMTRKTIADRKGKIAIHYFSAMHILMLSLSEIKDNI